MKNTKAPALPSVTHHHCIGLYTDSRAGLCVHDDFGDLVPLRLTPAFYAWSYVVSSDFAIH